MKILKIILPLCAIVLLSHCGTHNKIRIIRETMVAARTSIPSEDEVANIAISENEISDSDTLVVEDLQGNSVILMKAVKDEETGEMVATEKITAAVVTARFRNVAERNGEVTLEFDINVPESMLDEKWQVRLTPRFFIMGDTLKMEDFIITGTQYRQNQLDGYNKYQKYLSNIITDPDNLMYMRLLNIFKERNPYPKKVTESQISDYYTKKTLKRINEKRKRDRDKKYKKYITIPIDVENIKKDSVSKADKSIIYRYIQTIATRPKLRKIEMVLNGKILMGGKMLYKMPSTTPLTFYISSLSSFTEQKTKYVEKIIERTAQANTAAYISFNVGDDEISDTISHNKEEIKRISDNIVEILENKEFDLDSIIISASCSPEGSVQSNEELARKRAESINRYYSKQIYVYKMEKKKDTGAMFNIDLTKDEENEIKEEELEIRMITRSKGEEWDRLYKLIDSDTVISRRKEIIKLFSIKDLDKRESELRKLPDYPYIRVNLYPLLRVVKFDFYLHRKGMIKDTIHTTEIDTIYRNGLIALEKREYEKAIEYLRPYSDFNTALAYSCLDYNASALSILEKLPQSAKRDYMLAILYSRQGKDKKAVKHYLFSIEQDQSMIHRGNLDPEISVLIKKYNINNY